MQYISRVNYRVSRLRPPANHEIPRNQEIPRFPQVLKITMVVEIIGCERLTYSYLTNFQTLGMDFSVTDVWDINFKKQNFEAVFGS